MVLWAQLSFSHLTNKVFVESPAANLPLTCALTPDISQTVLMAQARLGHEHVA